MKFQNSSFVARGNRAPARVKLGLTRRTNRSLWHVGQVCLPSDLRIGLTYLAQLAGAARPATGRTGPTPGGAGTKTSSYVQVFGYGNPRGNPRGWLHTDAGR